jgi:hypothetical protein
VSFLKPEALKQFKINTVATCLLKNGTRSIVEGGRLGIILSEQVDKLFIHTHPYSTTPTGPSIVDFNSLRLLNQTSSYLLERGTIYRFYNDGRMEIIKK